MSELTVKQENKRLVLVASGTTTISYVASSGFGSTYIGNAFPSINTVITGNWSYGGPGSTLYPFPYKEISAAGVIRKDVAWQETADPRYEVFVIVPTTSADYATNFTITLNYQIWEVQ